MTRRSDRSIMSVPDTTDSGSDPFATLRARLAVLGIQEADLEESFVRSGGHGGQNVNKTSTCVVLTHRPTGLSVKCQVSREQGRNRLLARQLLLAKIEASRRRAAAAAQSARERLRRQKRPRSRAAKNRILADKAHNASRKASRRRSVDD